MDYILIIGLCATVLSVIGLIPQVWKTWQTKHSKDLSIKWLYMSTSAQLLWLIYVILCNIIPNIITASSMFILTVCLIIMKKMYD